MFCNNDCDSKATNVVIHKPTKDGVILLNGEPRKLYLCATCATAYEWGQASPEAELFDLDYYDDEGNEIVEDENETNN